MLVTLASSNTGLVRLGIIYRRRKYKSRKLKYNNRSSVPAPIYWAAVSAGWTGSLLPFSVFND